MNLSQLELNQWQLFNPKTALPIELQWNRLRDRLSGGKIAREMLQGRFPGGPSLGSQVTYFPSQWFRFAAHSIAIRPTVEGLFQRALNGSISAGADLQYATEYLGFDADGVESRYDYSDAFIDLEVILRRWHPYPKALAVQALQGIIIAETTKVDDTDIDIGACEFGAISIDQAIKAGAIKGDLLSKAEASRNYLRSQSHG